MDTHDRGGPRAFVRVLVGFVAVIFATTALGACGGGGSGNDEDEPLTAGEVADRGQRSTLMVVSRSGAGTPLASRAGNIIAGGSAWVYDAEEGLIVTNAHVVLQGSKVQAGFNATQLANATIVAINARDDLAMLRVSPTTLGGLEALPQSEQPVAQGDTVYALGYPSNATTDLDFLESPYQATQGIISTTEGRGNVAIEAFGEEENDRAGQLLDGLYQTDAAINAGNSGGPLVNDRGEVVGTNVAAGGENQGYAISSETLAGELPTLASGESTAWLGFGASALSANSVDGVVLTSTSLGAEGEPTENRDLKGAVELVSIAKDTPVDQQTDLVGELKFASRNDRLLVVTKVNNTPVTSQQEYINAVENIRSGEQVRIEWLAVTFTEDPNYGPFETRFAAP